MNMTEKMHPVIFGEVLFDCFPDGKKVLGGAPFNVAWHLQSFGDKPDFISRIGNDELGSLIQGSMQKQGMNTNALQVDDEYPTGQVKVDIIDGEPHYTITPDCAYDFIQQGELPAINSPVLIYHGTLALRNMVSRAAFQAIADNPNVSIFLDVNLRSPWWNKAAVVEWLKEARWAKMNEDEIRQLIDASSDLEAIMNKVQQDYDLELLLVTCGESGALAQTKQGERYSVRPEPIMQIVDTVGAGDAFTAVVLHGLMHNWELQQILDRAQNFASKILGIRGAIPASNEFYKEFS